VTSDGNALRNGSTRIKYVPGYRQGALTIVERLPRVRSAAYVLCRYDCGAQKRIAVSGFSSGTLKDCANRERHPRPKAPRLLTHTDAKRNVFAARGVPWQHRCRCGTKAKFWTYLHGDPGERMHWSGKYAGRPFSGDPNQYRATCTNCRRRWNEARRRTAPYGPSLAHIALWMLQATAEADAK